MKVRNVLLLSICMVILFLTGCMKNDDELSASKPIELTVWHYYSGMQKRAFDNAVKEFNDTVGLENGVYIKATGYGSIDNIRNAVMAAIEGDLDAKELPDLLTGYVHTLVPMYQRDLLVDLEDYFTDEELSEFLDTFLVMKKAYGGKLMSLPVARSTEFGMLNQTDFELFMNEAGYLAGLSYDDLYTFEGLMDIADVYYWWSDGKSFYGVNSLSNLANALAAQLGEDEGLISQTSGKAEAAYTEDIMRMVWEIYYEGIVRGWCNPDGRALSKQNLGELLYLLTPTINVSNFPQTVQPTGEAAYAVEMLALPMPYALDGQPKSLQLGGGIGIVKSDRKTESGAVLFLKWLSKDGNNGEFVVHSSGYMPVKKNDMENIYDITKTVLERQEEGYYTLNEKSENILKGTENYIRMFEEYELVFPSVYSQSYELTDILAGLTTLAMEARENVLDEWHSLAEQDEEQYQKIVERYCSESRFDKWYASFQQDVAQMIGGVEE